MQGDQEARNLPPNRKSKVGVDGKRYLMRTTSTAHGIAGNTSSDADKTVALR